LDTNRRPYTNHHVYSIKSDGFANGTGDFSGTILMNDGTGWSGSDMIKYSC
jgi:hypothetical protein